MTQAAASSSQPRKEGHTVPTVTRAPDGHPTLHVAKEDIDTGVFRRAALAIDDDLDYRRSDEVQGIAERLIAQHADTFADVRDLAVIYLLRRVDGEMDVKTIDALAKCVKAPALWRDVYGVDVAIWVDERYWQRFDARRREAVIMHELLHIGVTDAGKVKLQDHSVEEFGMVARLYGQWLPDLERFAEQLALFESDSR